MIGRCRQQGAGVEGISGNRRLAARTSQDTASELAKATVTDIDRTLIDTKLAAVGLIHKYPKEQQLDYQRGYLY